jgi:hypothetical protein
LRVRREVTVSGAENSTANLLLSAANLRPGEPSDAPGDHDARELLRALDLHAGSPLLQPGACSVTRLAIDATDAGVILC